ncbi:helicase [Pochonia chlamydosporia 170]|uniref:Helicase n=1 Tax=Pochonia chlamydosporia 170 TaxID=1380566 RepID=A0A179G0X7_METCM|nr:helicase [Pochonia chlamydosporia 170]OAQ70971.2 helicase [Pochonia chlamydosporia 170]
MSNNLKRVLHAAHEEADSVYYGDGSPRSSSYVGPALVNPNSDTPLFEIGNSLPEMFSNILLGPMAGGQMSITPLTDPNYDLDSALNEWQAITESTMSLDPKQLTPDSTQAISRTSSATPESSQSAIEFNAFAVGNGLICYGMLHSVDVKLFGQMQQVNSTLRSMNSQYTYFTLYEEKDNVILRFKDEPMDFGYLRTGVCAALAPLLSKSYVTLEPLAPRGSLMDVIGRANKSAEAMVKVDINVYGCQEAMEEVGNALSKSKMWLQTPDHSRPGFPLHNPHFLPVKFQGTQVEENQAPSHAIADGTRTRRREDLLREMVQDVYKAVDKNRHLERVDGGDRVTQTLLKHQQEALGFMLERESGEISERYRLWEKCEEDGRLVYRHRITRARRENRPDERGGGILADEMGMGKSLSMLALVTKTLKDGNDWVRHQMETAGSPNTPKPSRSTLVVVSSALLIDNWETEVEKHLEPGLTVVRYHGVNRPRIIETIVDSDIVITTYNTLTTEYQLKSEPSRLHKIRWYRIILDEGKQNHSNVTSTTKLTYPQHTSSDDTQQYSTVPNKLSDIGALFSFIRVEPFSKPGIFRKWIELPFEQNMESPTVVKNRLIMLLESLCLRRTKELIKLPGLKLHTRVLDFTTNERKQYQNTKKILMRTIRHQVGEVEQSSKFGLFQANLQMRIFCNHGTFQKPFSWHRASRQDLCEAIVSSLGQDGGMEICCMGCKQPMPILGSSRWRNGFGQQCAHILCSECINLSAVSDTETSPQECPMCLRLTAKCNVGDAANGVSNVPSLNVSTESTVGDGFDHYFNVEGYSTKMRAVIEDVSRDVWTSKSIIFSCWTRTLYLLSSHLERAKIPYLRIDGDCPLSQRQTRLSQFASDSELPVLIMTTGTGAYGVFIVELQWNPGVENQAIARAIRLGQGRKVLVTRYMIRDTVEEEMQSQQLWKRQIAAVGFEDSPDEITV